jgi:hypothetical protein
MQEVRIHSVELFKDTVQYVKEKLTENKLCCTQVLFVTFSHGKNIQLFMLISTWLPHAVYSPKFVSWQGGVGLPVAPSTRTCTVSIVHPQCCLCSVESQP